ncbi:MFS transporter [Flectobacillus roseus]|uniref:MFS transporter n=1 Tax=Flectobacillus roseus TaxID=502259 RepID=A0ABT6Y2S8_9BACT|nr:MFS transporter [Flectobacillus roseus]MDI9857860.1 MFS transporter [Flectobacillus roseus]
MLNFIKNPKTITPIVVFAQFSGTSLWFAVNAILKDIQPLFPQNNHFLGNMTSAVQLGFVCGTLCYAILAISDRFSPKCVFVFSALLGALINLLTLRSIGNMTLLLSIRFGVGFFLAGVYPVGMKIMSDWHQKGLGKALGYLVGALVLGTAFGHFLAAIQWHFDWQTIIIAASVLSCSGALLIAVGITDGPYRQKIGTFSPKAIFEAFANPNFKQYAWGYFGHMFELYTFWAFVPVILQHYQSLHQESFSISAWSFGIIGMGILGCICTAELSQQRFTSHQLAYFFLIVSGFCCLLSPFIWQLPFGIFIGLLLIWGFSVVADSPQFSTLISQNAQPVYRASAITIVNSIGFAITVISIMLLQNLQAIIGIEWLFFPLSLGMITGIITRKRGN